MHICSGQVTARGEPDLRRDPTYAAPHIQTLADTCGSRLAIAMGCCFSLEANAKETRLPIPQWGKPFRCRLKKKGMLEADYAVYNEYGEQWMLIDAVGAPWDDGYVYYLKHRAPGQVDWEGNATSTTLGAVNIQGDWDAFSFKVSGAGRDVDLGQFYDVWDGDFAALFSIPRGGLRAEPACVIAHGVRPLTLGR